MGGRRQLKITSIDNLLASIAAVIAIAYHGRMLLSHWSKLSRPRRSIKLICIFALAITIITQISVVLGSIVNMGYFEASTELLVASLLGLAMADYGPIKNDH